jgi:hypothetical protein
MKSEEKYSTAMSDHGADATSSTGKEVDGAPLIVKTSRDDKIARGGRITVMAVLLVSAVTIAALTYFLLSKSEYSSFESQVCAPASVAFGVSCFGNHGLGAQ